MTSPPSTTAAHRPDGARKNAGAQASGGGRLERLRANPWLTLVSVALGVIMVGLDGTVVSIANPFIARDLDASLQSLQWVTNAYLLALAVLLIVGGKLGDRFGRKKVFLVGIAGFAVTSLLVGLSGSIGEVIVWRALQGVFGALLMPNTLALLRSVFPAEKLNSAIGIWGASSAISIAAGPIIGGLLVENVSWESVFYLNIPVGVVALVVGLAVVRESRNEEPGQRFDPLGLLLLSGGLFALVYGVVKAQSWGWGSVNTLGFLGGAVVLLVLFVLAELRVAQPLLPMSLFRDRSVTLGSILVLVNFFAMFGVLFFLTLYLQNVHGYSAVDTGLRLLPLTAVFMVGSPVAASLTTRFGPRVPIGVGMFVLSLALFWMTTLGTHTSYLRLWPSLLAIGVGIAFVSVASAEAIVGNAPLELSGVAGGLQSTAMQLGGAIGTSVLGSVLAARVEGVLFDRTVSAGAPPEIAARAAQGTEEVVQGLVPTSTGASGQVADAVAAGAHAAFMSGLHVALLVGATVALLGALAAPLIRTSGRPGDAVPAFAA
ncbi:drug resistance transporter, EmrB/QacA subfamily [Parafrankia irregularis]|uniref:Drug resistance transporter, EmrB/QacA subfamily n=1 Tax=Parafrankia irregularis TaxID=795642 RepID=A0A0S4QYM6_9ACTN|nr:MULTISPECIES: MFS transporter [Parafrankia]MBE3204882.1 MFS transporter [Parafrankia sp. CH37]CUU60653.1 drug resistance transporter, EmrB/QacA subfamily [Parafrankia irregularis]